MVWKPRSCRKLKASKKILVKMKELYTKLNKIDPYDNHNYSGIIKDIDERIVVIDIDMKFSCPLKKVEAI